MISHAMQGFKLYAIMASFLKILLNQSVAA